MLLGNRWIPAFAGMTSPEVPAFARMTNREAGTSINTILLLLSLLCAPSLHAQQRRAVVTVDPRDSIAAFDPITALGSTIDGHTEDATRHIFTRANVSAMKSANFHPISYRLRTELGIEAWHWNPRGHWSDAAHRRGYWVSDDAIGPPIRVSYGYRLPRRGNTIDQANDDGYSRLTDGDTTSFWKSNPYLDSRYTHDPAHSHPQWVIVDLEHDESIDAIRIMWGVPYATDYEVQYWEGEQPRGPDDNADDAGWRTFDGGAIQNGGGGDITRRLAARAVSTRWIRILLHTSSGRAPAGSGDMRDRLGFAIREIFLGRIDTGTFHEVTRHATNPTDQSRTYVSSTDPWHRATDRDEGTEQPGIDLVFESGITRGLPMLTPVGVLYDTPANAAALLRYARRRHYAIPRIELGEEPDGQFISPLDFAALYMQVADSLRAADPHIILGGPSLQDARTKVMMAWKESDSDERSWLARYVSALADHGRGRELGFVSFEFYPFDNACTASGPQLAQVARKIRDAIAQFRRDGVPESVPLLMTEYGYSPFSTASEMNRAGAILNSVAVAEFLADGGSQAFFYGTEPSSLDRDAACDSWGDNTLFIADDDRHILARNATYHAARMLTTLWADSAGGPHSMLATKVTGGAPSSGRAPPIESYALRRPDGKIALLIVNRDPANSWTADVRGIGDARAPVDVWRLSAEEYTWHPNGAKGFAKPDTGPRRMNVSSGEALTLPPYSIVVMRQH
jgi:hypothetical protein